MCVWKVAVLSLVAACGAKLADDPTQLGSNVDANTGSQIDADLGSDPDGGTVVGTDAPISANTRVVYLNFVGANLKKGTTSDATTNTVAWMYNAQTGVAPPTSHSQADIDTIRDGVIARLTGIATVTVSRPTSGQYVMIVYGGAAGNVHSFYGTAVNQLDCGDLVKNDVAWIADSVAATNAIDTTMGAIGFGLGLSGTLATDDCMCSWGDNCARSGACTLHENIARATNVANDPNTGMADICPGATQNEKTTFMTAFTTP
jgi:hypothetical protein